MSTDLAAPAPAAPSTEGHRPLDFTNKLFLAPMVRVCTAAFRMLSRRHGADVCFTDELIDLKLLQCQRVKNDTLGTTDLITRDGGVVLRTCAADRPLVAQIGTANPQTALDATRLIEDLVDAVDVNMGCPVHFSTQGGMGYALMQNPKLASDIVSHLAKNLSVPVTAKIRLLKTPQETADFIAMLKTAGAAAVTVHARRGKELRKDPPHWDELAEVARIVREAGGPPLVANGGVNSYEDIERLRAQTGISSVMVGSAAMNNASVFSATHVDADSIAKEFLHLCVQYDTVFPLAKYPVHHMVFNLPKPNKRARQLSIDSSKTMQDLWNIWWPGEQVPDRVAITPAGDTKASLVEAPQAVNKKEEAEDEPMKKRARPS